MRIGRQMSAWPQNSWSKVLNFEETWRHKPIGEKILSLPVENITDLLLLGEADNWDQVLVMFIKRFYTDNPYK